MIIAEEPEMPLIVFHITKVFSFDFKVHFPEHWSVSEQVDFAVRVREYFWFVAIEIRFEIGMLKHFDTINLPIYIYN